MEMEIQIKENIAKKHHNWNEHKKAQWTYIYWETD